MIFCKIKTIQYRTWQKDTQENDLKSLEEINKAHSKSFPFFVSENNKLRRNKKE